MTKRKRKAIFLDRDGTLNEDQGYVHKLEDFKLLPGVIEGLKLLKNDFLFFIITNQSGIGRGYYTIEDFHNFNNHLLKVLEEHNIKILKIYYCPHSPYESCDCKKPKTKNIEKFVLDYNIDIKESWVIGDHPTDSLLGINAGCKTIFLCTGHGEKHFNDLKERGIVPTFISQDFLSAAKKILNEK